MKLMLAAGATDSIISVYSAEDNSNLSSLLSFSLHKNNNSHTKHTAGRESDP